MLFTEIIAVYSEGHETNKYTSQFSKLRVKQPKLCTTPTVVLNNPLALELDI